LRNSPAASQAKQIEEAWRGRASRGEAEAWSRIANERGLQGTAVLGVTKKPKIPSHDQYIARHIEFGVGVLCKVGLKKVKTYITIT
jgi:hypothetical protein